MDMIKYLLFITLLTYNINISAQIIHREINWDNNEVNSNITYSDLGIPVYSETLQLESTYETIHISNLTFEDFDEEINNLSQIPIEIQTGNIRYQNDTKTSAWIEFIPVIKVNNQLKKLVSFDIEIIKQKSVTVATQQKDWKSSSVLSNGKWVKIKTQERGVYKIPYSQLQSWGFSNPSQVNLYGNGGYVLPKMNDEEYPDDLVQNSIWHGKDSENQDCLFFYSTGTIKWNFDEASNLFTHERNDYSDYAFYYLSDQGNTSLIEDAESETASFTQDVSTFTGYLVYEDEKVNLIETGRRWYGDRYTNGQSRNYNFSVSHLNQSSPVKVHVEFAGRSELVSRFKIFADVNQVDEVTFEPVDVTSITNLYASARQSTIELSGLSQDFRISLRYLSSNSSSYGWLDFIELNFKNDLVLDQPQLIFRDNDSVGDGTVTRFNLTATSSNIQIWDITNFTNPKSIQYSQSGNLVQFKVKTDSLKEFIAFNPDEDIPEPEFVEDIENQNIHAASIPEMIIISHPDFLQQANELAEFHEQYDQMTVSVVTPEMIYNEFSSGMPDVSGIRNYLRMCYNKTNSGEGELKYVLLFGDGSFDNKDILGKGLNFIPTYQSKNSLVPTSSFVSDDFFVLLDEGEGEYQGFIDLGIGRIPAKNTQEASIFVDKIKNYSSSNSLGEWRNVISFIGDDEDLNTHMTQAEQLADDVNAMNPAYFTDKIYLDAYQEQYSPGGETYPDVNSAIYNRVKNGALILNYTGHANEFSLASEKILNTSDIDNWTNYNKLPIFITATCEFSRFDANENSGGEHILFNPDGGGIGLFSTTRVVFSNENFILNQEFYKHVFSQDENGKNLRMGDVMKFTKNGISTGINKRNFTLLADPALSLSFPKYNVVTETINGIPAGSMNDTISALSTVTIKGKITDHLGNKLSDFNGELISTVYDKKDTVYTLGNGGETPFKYKLQNEIIYKGVTTVTSGEFEFSFIVPKDISYAVGPGKIIYYANNGEDDANGFTEDFLIGGSSNNSISDLDGPEIDLYLNDENFQSGDEVGKNPVLYAIIQDETGINTVGSGIGHDITAIIDGDENNLIILNDYYLSDKDSYTSGSVIYPLRGLEPGEHTITLKAWDVLNNSSEQEITFTITDKLEIENVICYPNPVSSYTNFQFTHNRTDESFDTRIEIYSYTGSLIDIINERINSNGKESMPVLWEVSKSQVLVRSGVYLYRIIIDADDGSSASKTGKMVISRY